MILFFKQLGLTNTECAVISGVMPIFNCFYKLVIGAVADKLQRHREMMLIFALTSTVMMSCLLLVPPVEESLPPEPESDRTLHYVCEMDRRGHLDMIECNVYNASNVHPFVAKSGLDQEEWHQIKHTELEEQSNCSEELNGLSLVEDGCLGANFLSERNGNNSEYDNFICKLDCTKYPNELLSPSQPVKEMFGKTFWMVFCLYFVGFNVMASNWGLLYGMNYAILGEKRNNFGRQRMWGTFGALITSVISAIAMNKYGSVKPEINYTPCFIGFGVWTVVTGISGMFFKLPHMIRNPTMARDLFKLFKQPAIFLLFVVLFIMGFLFGAVETFLFVFLRSLGASSWTLGACLFVRYLCEIPSLYYSGRIIKRIGHIKCLYIVLICYSIRYLGTSLIPSPWWELPFSAMKSVVFSIGFTAVSVYTSLITPPSMHATLQATVQTIHYGIGILIVLILSRPATALSIVTL